MSRLVIFVAGVLLSLYGLHTVHLPVDVRTVHVSTPLSDAMRERNEQARKQCRGTVRMRRRCWAEWPLSH